MSKPSSTVTADLASATSSDSLQAFQNQGVDINVTGTFSATFVVERSKDGSTKWTAIEDKNGNSSFTTAKGFGVFSYSDHYYRVRVSSYTSGTVEVNLSSGSRDNV